VNLWEFDWKFLLAILGGALIRLVTSEKHSLWRSAISVLVAVFAALVFTDPVMAFLAFPEEPYRNGIAALLALTGEGAMRFAISLSNDPTKLRSLLRKWLGHEGGGGFEQ